MRTYLVLIASCLSLSAFAQPENAQRRRNFNHDNSVALKYFDPVSYFKDKPLKGETKFSYMYKSIEYYFASAENMEEFKKSPAKYEPAYGGWCAFHMAKDGQRVKINPSTYKIIDGKLYLFSNFNGNNMLLKWNHDEKKLKQNADTFWVKKMN